MAVRLKTGDGILWKIALCVESADQCRGLAIFLLEGHCDGAAFFAKRDKNDSWATIAHNVLREWCTLASSKATGEALYKVLLENKMNSTAEDFKEQLLGGEVKRSEWRCS